MSNVHLYVANDILTLMYHCTLAFPLFLYIMTHFQMLKVFYLILNIIENLDLHTLK